MTLGLVLIILAAHWFADFEEQTNWMAMNKSKWQWPIWRYTASWAPLTSHVLAYMWWLWILTSVHAIWLIGVWLAGQGPKPPADVVGRVLLWAFGNGVLHFLTDMWTSRWTSALWFIPMAERPKKHLQGPDDYPYYCGPINDEKRHQFFVMIGFDQLIHGVCLFTTASWWLQ